MINLIKNYYKFYLSKVPFYLRSLVLFTVISFVFLSISQYEKYKDKKNNMNSVDFIIGVDPNQIITRTQDKINVEVKENMKSGSALLGRKESVENDEILSRNEFDYPLGDEMAPVVIIEYSSFRCPHCITFHNENMKNLERDYINTNKVYYIKRLFLQKDTIMGVLLTHCAPNNKKSSLIDDLYNNTDKWIGNSLSNMESLKEIASNNGFSEAMFNSCIADKDLANELLTKQNNDLKKIKVYSTPTVFINKKRKSGAMSYSEFSKLIEEELKK